MHRVSRRGRRDLAQRRVIVQHPDAAAVGAGHQVVAVNHQVAIRRGGEIELQRLPVVAVVERDVHPALRAREQQPRLFRVAPNHPGEAAARQVPRQAAHDRRPRLAVVARAEEIRLVVAGRVEVDRHVRRPRIEVGRVDRQDVAPPRDRQVGNRHVLPGLAFVPGQFDQAVVGPDPNHAPPYGRQRERLDRAPDGGAGRAAPAQAVGGRRDVLRVPQVGGQLGPVHPAVRRGHHELECRDQLVLVPGRKGEGLRDRESSVQGRIDVGAHVDPLLARVSDLQDSRAARVDDVGVQGIGNRGAPLPPGHRIPIERCDGAQVAAAARTDGARVLLRPVHPVGIRIVDRDVIDLVGGLIVPRAPGSAAVQGHDRALVESQQDTLAVGGVDPHLLRVVAPGSALETGERGAAVGGLVAGRVDGVDDVGVPGVDVDAAVVAPLAVRDAPVGGVHLAPRGAAVVGAVQAEVADQEHALRVGIQRHRHRRSAAEPRQAAARDLVPREAFVGRLEELGLGGARLRTTTPTAPGAGGGDTGRARDGHDVMPHAGGEHDLGAV